MIQFTGACVSTNFSANTTWHANTTHTISGLRCACVWAKGRLRTWSLPGELKKEERSPLLCMGLERGGILGEDVLSQPNMNSDCKRRWAVGDVTLIMKCDRNNARADYLFIFSLHSRYKVARLFALLFKQRSSRSLCKLTELYCYNSLFRSEYYWNSLLRTSCNHAGFVIAMLTSIHSSTCYVRT